MKVKKSYLTYNIIIVFIIIFILDFFVFIKPNKSIFTVNHLVNGNDWGWLTEYGRLVNAKSINGQWWRLLTVIFLHSGVIHLLVNSIALGVIGVHLEKVISKTTYLYLFIICGIISSFCIMFFTNGAVGASGAIYGLIGSYIILMIKERRNFLKDFKDIEVIWLIAYLTLPNLSGMASIISHLSGFVGGIIFISMLSKRKIKA